MLESVFGLELLISVWTLGEETKICEISEIFRIDFRSCVIKFNFSLSLSRYLNWVEKESGSGLHKTGAHILLKQKPRTWLQGCVLQSHGLWNFPRWPLSIRNQRILSGNIFEIEHRVLDSPWDPNVVNILDTEYPDR